MCIRKDTADTPSSPKNDGTKKAGRPKNAPPCYQILANNMLFPLLFERCADETAAQTDGTPTDYSALVSVLSATGAASAAGAVFFAPRLRRVRALASTVAPAL